MIKMINKNMRIWFSLLVILSLSAPPPVWAQLINPVPETDASGAAAETNKTGEDVNSTAAKAEEKAQKSFIDRLKGWYKTASSKVETMMAIYNNVQETTANVNRTVAAGQTVYNDANEAKDSVTTTAKNSEIGQTATLSAEFAKVKKQRDDRKNALIEETQSKSQASSENLSLLQQMYQSASDENAKKQIEKQMQQAQKEYDDYAQKLAQIEQDQEAFLQSDKEYAQLSQEYNRLETEMNDIAQNAANEAFNLAKSFFMSKKQRKDAYEEIRGKYFLKKDEKETPAANERVIKVRRETLFNDVVYATTLGYNFKKKSEELQERIDQIKGNAVAVDGQQTAINMLIEQQVIDLEILYDYTQMLIAELRVTTANDMLNMPTKLKNYDQDPSVLKMDNYVFTEKDIDEGEGKEGLFQKILGEIS